MCKATPMTKLLRVIRSAILLTSPLGVVLSIQAYQIPQAPALGDKTTGEKCSIEGRVLSSTTGQPLGRATIMLIAGAVTNRVTTESGEDGRFSFVGLNAARYTLSAQRAGYLGQYYGAGGASASSTYLVLAPGQQLKDVLFKLIPAAVISGRVLDQDGAPVGSMVVQALRARWVRGVRLWASAGTVRTNDLGEFRIANLTAGEYLVPAFKESSISSTNLSAQPPGDKPEREYVATFFPNATDAPGAVPVQVAAGTEAGGTEIRLRRTDTVRIRGKVISAPEGNVVVVNLSPQGVTDSTVANLQGARNASSRQKDGSFELNRVVPGAYMLSASFMNGQTVFVAALPLQVGERHIEGLVLRPVAAIELAGAVVVADKTSTQLSGLQIRLEPVEYLGIAAAPGRASEEGRFALTGIQPGRYRVQVSNLPEGSYVQSVRYGGQEVTEEGIDLTSGASSSLQISLSLAGAQVDGVVQGKDDKPVSGATVALVPDSKRYSLFREARTGENGSYSLKGVAPGEYKILAWDNIETGAYQDPDFLKRYEGKADKLSLTEKEHKSVSLKVTPLQAH